MKQLCDITTRFPPWLDPGFHAKFGDLFTELRLGRDPSV